LRAAGEREEVWRGGAAVQPAILSNQSLEPTAPSRFVLRGAEEE
jgi:hypothetical protein